MRDIRPESRYYSGCPARRQERPPRTVLTPVSDGSENSAYTAVGAGTALATIHGRRRGILGERMNTAEVATEPSAGTKRSPMLEQYLEYKARHPDAMLLFQVGDFYEVFFEDAVAVARALNLTLTSRDKNSPQPTPMCGVPVAVVDSYVERLVDQGYSVALVSQLPASQQTGKGMFLRELERIVTPAVRITAPQDSTPSAHVLAAVWVAKGEAALCFSDVQSGRIAVREGIALNDLASQLSLVNASEVVLPREVDGSQCDRRLAWVQRLEALVPRGALKFRAAPGPMEGGDELRRVEQIRGYSHFGPAGRRAVRLLVRYVDDATVGAQLPFSEVCSASDQGVLHIDATTRANLELLKTQREGLVQGSLFHYLDRTCSVAGSRMLQRWLVEPLAVVERIRERHDAVELLRTTGSVRAALRTALAQINDLERISARLELQVVTPRELGALRDALRLLPSIREHLLQCAECGPVLSAVLDALDADQELVALLERALSDELPPSLQEGGVFRTGYDAELDRVVSLRTNGRALIAELEARERAAAELSSLRIKHNGVLGFFFEVSKGQAGRVPSHFIARQHTASAARFTTEELASLEQEVLGAEQRQLTLERRLFAELQGQARVFSASVRRVATALAELDVLCAFAELADREGLVRPEVDESGTFELREGRHPIVHAALRGAFVANSLHLGEREPRIAIITGPNMGGKSTFLRQAALAVVMAQAGSFVDAASFRFGVVDRIFARIGAADNLAEGESTFMVEMREASQIVARATPRSLVLIDELGRGTATADGLAIAQAVLEWLALKIGCRTLFATHFHELTLLDRQLPMVVNLSVGCEERGREVVFTHAITKGAANRSYGLEVARLADFPTSLLARARRVLQEGPPRSADAATAQLSIFEAAANEEDQRMQEREQLERLRAHIEGIDVMRTSPIEALQILEKLQRELRE